MSCARVGVAHCTAVLHLLPTHRNSWCLYLLAVLHAVAVDMDVQIAGISEPLLSPFVFLFLLLSQLQGHRVRFVFRFTMFPLILHSFKFPHCTGSLLGETVYVFHVPEI